MTEDPGNDPATSGNPPAPSAPELKPSTAVTTLLIAAAAVAGLGAILLLVPAHQLAFGTVAGAVTVVLLLVADRRLRRHGAIRRAQRATTPSPASGAASEPGDQAAHEPAAVLSEPAAPVERDGLDEHQEPTGGPTDPLTWIDTEPDLWRSVDGRYVIVSTVLPERRADATRVFTLRKIDAASRTAYPPGWTCGYFVDESYSLHEAQAAAERDSWVEAQGAARNVPADYPAAALKRFYWPISQGTSMGALAIVREGNRLVARVVGMGRRSSDVYEPGVFAELDLSALPEDGEPTVADLQLLECGGCMAVPSTAHGQDCDHAHCPECGEQWIMCGHESDRMSVWRGVDERAAVAHQQNWWTTRTDIDHLVEDYTRVIIAISLGQITWDAEAQTYRVVRIDNAELDRHGENGR
jgi:hypothetical protein